MKRQGFGIMLSILLLLALGVDATTVLWDVFCITQNPIPDITSISFTDGDRLLWAEVGMRSEQNGIKIKVSPSSSVVCEAVGNWLVASVGDVVSESTTRHLDPSQYFLHTQLDDDLSPNANQYTTHFLTGEPISVRRNSRFYLMFAVGDINIHSKQNVYYGWVEVTVSPMGEIGVGSSCINLDGDPIIVGYDLVPEPGVTGLLLFGLAALVFPRRKILR